jgi:hypothetical protein
MYTPAELYNSASQVLGTGESCPRCAKRAMMVTGLPCRYCIHNGDKLRIVRNVVCTLEGVPIVDAVIELRKGDFFVPKA